MNEEISNVKKIMKELNIPIERVKSIKVDWVRALPDRAFPRIKIKLFNGSNEKK
jgi:DUF4097 and DUF4098 domain-containing protein YvlB